MSLEQGRVKHLGETTGMITVFKNSNPTTEEIEFRLEGCRPAPKSLAGPIVANPGRRFTIPALEPVVMIAFERGPLY